MVNVRTEKQSATQYDDRTTAAIKRALVEIGQLLGSYQGLFAVVGGSVPFLLLQNEEADHVGTADIDLGLDPQALGDGEYAKLIKTLMDHGYEQREGLRRFQLVRKVDPKDGGERRGEDAKQRDGKCLEIGRDDRQELNTNSHKHHDDSRTERLRTKKAVVDSQSALGEY